MNKIDLIIDALSVAQNSVWSTLNQEALAYAVELKTESTKPERKYPNHETYCGTCGACTYKPWVGLTVEDQADILSRKWWDFEDSFDLEGFLRVTEAKLKEKNNG